MFVRSVDEHAGGFHRMIGYCMKGVHGEREIRIGKGKGNGGTYRSIGKVKSSTPKCLAVI